MKDARITVLFIFGACMPVVALVVGCSDPLPANAALSDAATFEAGPYQGPVSGGRIVPPPASSLAETPPSTFDGSAPCCPVQFSIDAAPDYQSVTLVGDIVPQGRQALTRNGDQFQGTACLPATLTVRYRFEVERSTGAGTETVVVLDPKESAIDDLESSWNLKPVICMP
jgi:hypothetical protein